MLNYILFNSNALNRTDCVRLHNKIGKKFLRMQNIVVQKSELKVIHVITLQYVFLGPGLVTSKMDVSKRESKGMEAFNRAIFYRHSGKTAATPAIAITKHLSFEAPSAQSNALMTHGDVFSAI